MALLLSALGLAGVRAGDFEEANRLYEKGDYAAAAKAYRQQLDRGLVSSALYFNLGNALFQSGEFGKGIWCFQQARRLAPRDPDIRANLRFARKEVAGAFAPEETGWPVLLRSLSPVEWNWLAAVHAAVLFGLMAARETLRNRAGGLLWAIRVFAVLAPVAIALCWAGHRAWAGEDEGVVIVDKLDARYGPLEDSKAAFQLVDGEEVKITDRKDEWLQVVNTSGQSGWVPAENILRIADPLP